MTTPYRYLALLALSISCSATPSFSAAPRFPKDLGGEDHCCPVVKRGGEYVLYWEIRSSRDAKASVSIVDFKMEKERVTFRQLSPNELDFRPNVPQPLDLHFTAPKPVTGRMLAVTLQSQMHPLPETSPGSCKICQSPD